MLYNAEKKQNMLDTLNNRVSSIVDVCVALVNEGYNLNKSKLTKLSWTTIMLLIISMFFLSNSIINLKLYIIKL